MMSPSTSSNSDGSHASATGTPSRPAHPSSASTAPTSARRAAALARKPIVFAGKTRSSLATRTWNAHDTGQGSPDRTARSSPLLIESFCNGLGDALVYCWLVHTLRGAGHPVLINPRGRALPIYDRFSVPSSWRTTASGALRGHPPKAIFPSTGWLSSWIVGHGFPLSQPVRPPYSPATPSLSEWASSSWTDRGHANLPRILICPDVMYGVRRWPVPYFALLARWLTDAGFRVLTLLHHWDPSHPYPYAIGGTTVDQLIALINSSDLVIGNDSGPAHIAGTLGKPTIAVCGGSPSLFFDHLPEVRTLHAHPNEIPCVSCNFQGDRGYASLCNHGCAALSALTPLSVLREAYSILGIPSEDPLLPSRFAPLLVRGAHRAADEDACSAVFHHDTYHLRELPFSPETILDVGAHIGSFSAKCRALWPSASIVQVEPDPAHHSVLRRSCPSFMPVAISYSSTEVSVTSSVTPGTGSTMGSFTTDGRGVPAVTLESILDGRGWDRCDLLKLDCEGAEYDILEHCDLSRFRHIVGEYHHQDRWDALVARRLSGCRIRILWTGDGRGEFWLTPPSI